MQVVEPNFGTLFDTFCLCVNFAGLLLTLSHLLQNPDLHNGSTGTSRSHVPSVTQVRQKLAQWGLLTDSLTDSSVSQGQQHTDITETHPDFIALRQTLRL